MAAREFSLCIRLLRRCRQWMRSHRSSGQTEDSGRAWGLPCQRCVQQFMAARGHRRLLLSRQARAHVRFTEDLRVPVIQRGRGRDEVMESLLGVSRLDGSAGPCQRDIRPAKTNPPALCRRRGQSPSAGSGARPRGGPPLRSPPARGYSIAHRGPRSALSARGFRPARRRARATLDAACSLSLHRPCRSSRPISVSK
jgi:hypothetical protein